MHSDLLKLRWLQDWNAFSKICGLVLCRLFLQGAVEYSVIYFLHSILATNIDLLYNRKYFIAILNLNLPNVKSKYVKAWKIFTYACLTTIPKESVWSPCSFDNHPTRPYFWKSTRRITMRQQKLGQNVIFLLGINSVSYTHLTLPTICSV